MCPLNRISSVITVYLVYVCGKCFDYNQNVDIEPDNYADTDCISEKITRTEFLTELGMNLNVRSRS